MDRELQRHVAPPLDCPTVTLWCQDPKTTEGSTVGFWVASQQGCGLRRIPRQGLGLLGSKASVTFQTAKARHTT